MVDPTALRDAPGPDEAPAAPRGRSALVTNPSVVLVGTVVLVLFALFVRARPFLRSGHAFSVSVDFDEGVDYAAAVLASEGLRPYRDFDFGHPPGVALIFSAFRAVLPSASVATGFGAARVAMCVVGALSVLVLLAIGRRSGAVLAGMLSAMLYATYPEAISAERGVFLEPLVNVFALAAVLIVAVSTDSAQPAVGGRASPPAAAWRWGLAGLLLALALTVKLTAIVWLPCFVLLALRTSSASCRRWGILGGVVGLLLFLAPSVWGAPAQFFEDVVFFQTARPPDGDAALGLRLAWIFPLSHLGINLLAAVALLGFRAVPAARRPAYFAAALTCGLTLATLLTSKGYWRQYNAQLAAPEAWLAGFAVFPIARLFRSSGAFASLWKVALAVLLLAGVRSAYRSGRGQAPVEQAALVEAIGRAAPKSACLVVFEPAWAIMADRFPSPCATRRIVIDPYLVMLTDALRRGQRYATTGDAFASELAQTRIRQELEAADVVVMDARGEGQLNVATKARLRRNYRPLTQAAQAEILVRRPVP
jgi:hypothetical protein